MRLLVNELGRLTQGIREIKGTNTIYFIDKSETLKDKLKQVTYARTVVGHKPHKLEKTEQESQWVATGSIVIMISLRQPAAYQQLSCCGILSCQRQAQNIYYGHL